MPRFHCLVCDRSFSSQTFRVDYRLKLPSLHLKVFMLLASKVTLRQMGRVLGVSRRRVEHRLDLLGDHCRAWHGRALRTLAARGGVGGRFVFDELETYEEDRHLKPLTVPVLVHRESLFVLHAGVAPLPSRRPVPPRKLASLQRMESGHGRRKSGSKVAVEQAFAALGEILSRETTTELVTDRKSSYGPALKRRVRQPIAHRRVSSKAPRGRWNPMFPVNHALAMMRDTVSRLVRRTWAASKRAWRLMHHLWVWIAFRNWVRERVVRPAEERRASAASRIGLAEGRLRVPELLRWRVLPRAA